MKETRNLIESRLDKTRVAQLNPALFEKELFYLSCNKAVAANLLKLKETGKKYKNKSNSHVAYAIGITDDLPSKPITQIVGSLPDVDYDCSDRDKIKDFLVRKYGVDRVALIGTYAALKTRGALKDLARQSPEEKISFEEANDVCKLFSVVKEADYEGELEFFEAALDNSPKLKEWFEKRPIFHERLKKMLGTIKNTGIHAGGIVVSDVPIYDVCPVTFDREEGLYVTQPEMAFVEYLGLIKYDFLGLKTLKILNRTFKLIKERTGKDVNFKNIPLDDKRVLALFQQGKTEGVFQFNSDLSVQILTSLDKVTSIEDPCITTSVARPGPMKSGMVDMFVKRKNGIQKVEYDHPLLEPIVSKTYGLYVYQEQVMAICTEIGKLRKADGYALIKAISKKNEAKMNSYKITFEKGATENKVPKETIEKIWSNILNFAGYGFNKSHAMAYTITGYICAYLKLYYPLEFMSSTLTYENKDEFKSLYPKWKAFIANVSILNSTDKFEISSSEPNDSSKRSEMIAMPLTQIAGIGDSVAGKIIAHRPYSSFEDYLVKTEGEIGIKTTKSLIFAGVFDCLKTANSNIYSYRMGLYEKLICFEIGIEPRSDEERINGVPLSSRKKKPTKKLLEYETELKEMIAAGRGALLNKELELLGVSTFNYYEFLGENGLARAENAYGKGVKYLSLKEVTRKLEKKAVAVVGAVSSMERIMIKKEGSKYKGKEMLKIILAEDEKMLEVIAFPDVLEKDQNSNGNLAKLTIMAPLMVYGKVSVWKENGKVSIILERGQFLT